MNLSFLSKASTLCLIAASLSTLAAVTTFLHIGIWAIAAIIATFAAGLAYTKLEALEETIEQTRSVCEKVANGDLEARIINIDNEDELAECQHAINTILDQMDAFMREASASLAAVADEQYYRRFLLEGMPGTFRYNAQTINASTKKMEDRFSDFARLTDQFEASVKAIANQVEHSADDLNQTAEVLTSAVENAGSQARVISASAETTSQNVGTVASAAEELSSSVSEISEQVAVSTGVSGDAVREVAATQETIQGLTESAHQIDQILALITDIAEQTNLLALNATIEAARAGDAGKGFAVVASEVKSLANQTAKATEEITRQVQSVQHNTEESVNAIGRIGATIEKMAEISAAIAAAVEQQGAATQEIASNMSQVAAGTQEVTGSILGVTQGVEETEQATMSVMEASRVLNKQSAALQKEIDAYLNEARGSSRQAKTASHDDGLSPKDIELIQSSFAKVAPDAEAVAEMFYNRLFAIAPEVKPLFSGDMKKQGRKLMSMLTTVVKGLDKLDTLVPAVEDLGRRHAGYGVLDAHYGKVAEALLWTLQQGLGNDFTADTKKAWTKAYTVLASVMQNAAKSAKAA